MSRGTWVRRLAPLGLLAATGCVATRGDLRVLQQDLMVVRAEQARADSLQRAQLRQLLSAVRDVSDSLRVARELLARHQGETGRAMYELGQQLITVQELTGQSQRRLQELRASLEARGGEAPSAAAMPAPTAGMPPTTGGGAAAPPAPPGPNQLFQLAQEQLRRGSAVAARAGFGDLLSRFPQSDLAPEALFFIAESHGAEGNAAAADSVYALVVTRFPNAPKAPTALFKRARAKRLAGDLTEARALFRRIIDRYPRSDEAILAADELKDFE